MRGRYILTEYVHEALERAVYDKLEDQTFAGSIPGCPGVVAFDPTLHRCERELRSTLEDWILLGLELAHLLPVDACKMCRFRSALDAERYIVCTTDV